MKRLIGLMFLLAVFSTACGSRAQQPALSITGAAESQPEETYPATPSPLDEHTEAHSMVSVSPAIAAEADSDPAVQPSAADADMEQEEMEDMLNLQIGDTVFTAQLAENSTVDALRELLQNGPLVVNMSDYAGMEKGADLGVALPQNNEPMDTVPGDIILYQGRTFVIYYDTNSWSLTPVGKIVDVDADALRAALGAGDVTVTLSLG